MTTTTIDQYYVLNLAHNWRRRTKCLKQFADFSITNVTFIDAINAKDDDIYKPLYEEIVAKMSQRFVEHNFPRGALGCLLSHLECIKDAQKNHYKHIIVLEDDFLFRKDYHRQLRSLLQHLDTSFHDWDFIYLGKKQGTTKMGFQILHEIHSSCEYHDIQDIDTRLYRPNYKTWATHALLIRNTIFDEILTYNDHIIAPIDIMLMRSYPKYTFACVKSDLVITADDIDSEILNKTKVDWGWDRTQFVNTNHLIVRNFVVLGFKTGNHTHRYIHQMYVDFVRHYFPEFRVEWVDNEQELKNLRLEAEETIVFASPCHQSLRHQLLPSKAFYILHLDEFKNNGYKSIEEFTRSPAGEIITKENKYIVLTCREKVCGLHYFEKNKSIRTICLPWFANTLHPKLLQTTERIAELYDRQRSKKYFCFMGSIWELNFHTIARLIEIFERNKLYLLLKGRVFGIDAKDKKFIEGLNKTHMYVKFVPFNYKDAASVENTFEFLDKEFGVKALLPLQGDKHNDDYMSNRVFETISLGYVVATNNRLTKTHFSSVLYNDNIEDLVLEYSGLLDSKEAWINMYQSQINEFVCKFYGYHNIRSVLSFLQETMDLPTQEIAYTQKKLNVLCDTNDLMHGAKHVFSDEDIREVLVSSEDTKDIVLHNIEMLDPYLVERLQSLAGGIHK